MLNFFKTNIDKTTSFFDDPIRERFGDIVEKYSKESHGFHHKDDSGGWFFHENCKFFGPSRILNRIIYSFISQLVPPQTVLDFGCGDGLLIKLLRDSGHDAFGLDNKPKISSYNFLGVNDFINKETQKCDIFISLGVAHEMSPSEFLSIANSFSPKLILCDRNLSRGLHSSEYYHKDCPFQSFYFANCFEQTGLKTDLLAKVIA